jgi:hypothetical protein
MCSRLMLMSGICPYLALDVCARHGPFDVIIDDGGHSTPTILGPLQSMFPSSSCMKPASLYAIEDMHVMNYPGHAKRPSLLYNIVGEAFWSLHHGSTAGVPSLQTNCIRPSEICSNQSMVTPLRRAVRLVNVPKAR